MFLTIFIAVAIVLLCATLLNALYTACPTYTYEQMCKDDYVLEEQSAIDASKHVYRATVFTTNKKGHVTYREVYVDEHVVMQLVSNNK